MNRWSLLLPLLVVTPLRADDWPQFLGPRRDGASLEKGIKPWGKQGPPLLWQREIGEGFSGPVIAGGRVIVFHRKGSEEIVESWDAVSGKPQWRYAYPTDYSDALNKGDGPRATPVIAGKRVITLGAQGVLSCVDLQSGEKVWMKKLHDDYRVPPSYFGVGTTPLVVDDLVLVNVGAKGAGIVGFALADGKEVWKATNDGPSYSSPALAEVDGARRAVFFTRNGAVVLDPIKGTVLFEQRWRARYDASVNAATPLILGDVAFFSTSYETGALFVKLKKSGGEELWSGEDLMSNHYNTCVFHDGHLYGFDGRQEAGPSFRCVDVKAKKIAWDRKRFGCGSLILVDGKLITLLETGELVMAEATPVEHRELARAAILDGGPCRAQIALADGRLYARDQRKLGCWDLKK